MEDYEVSLQHQAYLRRGSRYLGNFSEAPLIFRL